MLDRVIPVACRPPLAAFLGAAFLSVAGSACGAGQAGGAGGSGGAAQGTGGAAGQTPTGTGGRAGRGGTSRRHGGGAGSAGRGGSGGTTGRPHPQQVLNSMPPGWNLGNSFDAYAQRDQLGQPHAQSDPDQGGARGGVRHARIPVTWTDHLGAAPAYTIDSAWMAKVTRTAQWAVDEGMFVFVNTHHDADGQWITFPATASAAAAVAAEVKAVWTQIATAFKSFDSHLMLECFNEPHNVNGNDAATQTDLNMYLEACVNAIRGTGGANATRLIMIQPVGASPLQDGIQSMMNASIIGDPNLLISIHTYHPTNFGLSETRYAWGSADDYTRHAELDRTGDPGLVADAAHRHRRVGLHGGSSDDQQSRSRPGLLSRRDDGRHGSGLVGQRKLR